MPDPNYFNRKRKYTGRKDMPDEWYEKVGPNAGAAEPPSATSPEFIEYVRFLYGQGPAPRPTMNIQDLVQQRKFACPKCPVGPVSGSPKPLTPRFTENQYGTGRTVDLSIIFECHGERATYIVPNSPITRNAKEAMEWVNAMEPFTEERRLARFPTYAIGKGIVPVACNYTCEKIKTLEQRADKEVLKAFGAVSSKELAALYGLPEDQYSKEYEETLRKALMQQKQRELMAAKATGDIVRDSNGRIIGVITGSGSVAQVQELPIRKQIIRVADRSGWIAGEDAGINGNGRQLLRTDGGLREVFPPPVISGITNFTLEDDWMRSRKTARIDATMSYVATRDIETAKLITFAGQVAYMEEVKISQAPGEFCQVRITAILDQRASISAPVSFGGNIPKDSWGTIQFMDETVQAPIPTPVKPKPQPLQINHKRKIVLE